MSVGRQLNSQHEHDDAGAYEHVDADADAAADAAKIAVLGTVPCRQQFAGIY